MGCGFSKGDETKEGEKPSELKANVSANTTSAPLTEQEIEMRIESPTTNETLVFSDVEMLFGWISQRGYYPNAPNKENQDCYCIIPKFGDIKDQAFFSVFDGHGKDGHYCARFARDNLPEILRPMLEKCGSSAAVKDSLRLAHLQTNANLHNTLSVDDSLSGTTAISVLFRGRSIFVSNVGDSRAILVSRTPDDKLLVKPLSNDQTPYRVDERERVKRAGARVLSMDQMEGLEPIHENWGVEGVDVDEGGDPPRIWSPLGNYPGTAFTRSIGDLYAEELGVIADPEILESELRPDDLYLVIASDGVFEFMSNQMVADIIHSESDPLNACRAVVAQAYGLWLQYEVRTDDISVIVIKLSGMGGAASASVASATSPRMENSKPVRRVMSREKKKTMIQDNVLMRQNSEEDEEEPVDLESLVFEKAEEERQLIGAAIKNSFLFQHLNATQRDTVINVMQRVVVSEGEWVITQGDQGDRLYIIEEGKFEVRVSSVFDDPTGGAVVHVYEPTTSFHPTFGELSLMYGKPRAASVIALSKGILWALDRKVFRSVVLRTVNMRKDIVRTLRSVAMFNSLNLQQIQRLADLLSEDEQPAGTYIIRQGEVGDTFYVIMQGRCSCTVNVPDEDPPEKVVMKLKDNDYFGERALLHSVTRAANVIATTKVHLLYIGKAAFEEVLGPLANIIEDDRQRREDMALRSLRSPDSVHEVSMLGVVASDTLGPLIVGSVGSSTPNVCLRVIVFSDVEAGRFTAHALSCVATSKAVTSSDVGDGIALLPKLLHSYVTEYNNAMLCLYNSPVVADLSSLIRSNQVLLPEASVIYVAACVVSALDTLHKIGVIYRSVQPDTIHVDASGRVVLMDYRISKVGAVGVRTFTICGAADYLAPEQITLQGHGFEVDFWSLGVMLFELSSGELPFSAPSEVALFSKISSLGTDSMPTLQMPEAFSPALASLIGSLIVREPERRLGAGPEDDSIKDLKSHEAFREIDWENIQHVTSPLAALAGVALQEATSTGVNQEMKNHWSTDEPTVLPSWVTRVGLGSKRASISAQM